MLTQRPRIFAADFETTVYTNQSRTDVWAAAIVELGHEDVKIYGCIEHFIYYLICLECNSIVYFHNLKFDGAFILSYLYNSGDYEEASEKPDNGLALLQWKNVREMKSNTFKYIISDMGQWYSITIKHGIYTIEIRDSLKLLPFTLKKIGKDFKTEHQKLTMKYEGYRYPNCKISEAEKQYISNDVLVLKEALEIMYKEGHKKLTIGSCCLEEFKNDQPFMNYNKAFPNLYDIELDKTIYGSENVGEYIRKSYRGGWCYLVPEKANKIKRNGTTADVNSLYPSMMSSESGNWFPVGTPTFWKGDFPEEVLKWCNNGIYGERIFFFVRFRCRFKIKSGYLPFIQIKNDILHYKANESLTTSDYYSRIDGKYHRSAINVDGKLVPALATMTVTQTDWWLINEHYDLSDVEILDGCYFKSAIGIFDDYIEKYKKMKIESKGAKRQIAKLFLNNLYGKMATNTNNSFKVCLPKDDTSLSYYTVISDGKKPGYIPIGTAITSYARNFTIRAAQMNYHGPNKKGFIYADTDSIHCDLGPDEIKGITVHKVNFCCWKLESCWDKSIFIRQKAYAEHITHTDLEPVENSYWDMKCAGMPEFSKLLFLTSVGDKIAKENLLKYCEDNGRELNEFEKEFISRKRKINDFQIGLEVPGKLVPKNIPGGIVLQDTTFKLRDCFR